MIATVGWSSKSKVTNTILHTNKQQPLSYRATRSSHEPAYSNVLGGLISELVCVRIYTPVPHKAVRAQEQPT